MPVPGEAMPLHCSYGAPEDQEASGASGAGGLLCRSRGCGLQPERAALEVHQDVMLSLPG